MIWREALDEALARLDSAGFPSGAVDARRLVETATGTEGGDYLDVLDESPTNITMARFDAMLARRLDGEPLQYVLGSWGFRQLDLMVDRRVLIPRPETEVTAGVALAEVDRVVAEIGADHHRRMPVADLGTGSGAIGLSLAVERPSVEVWATDASPEALAVAGANLAGTGRPGLRVRLAEGSWFDALPDELQGQLGVIVSNPPYIAADEELPPEVAEWEPQSALRSGPTGLDALEVLIDGGPRWLVESGSLVLELAPHQASQMAERAEMSGYREVEVVPDLTGRDRILVARRRAG